MKINLTYAGQRQSFANPKNLMFLYIEESTGDEQRYSKLLKDKQPIGSIIDCERTEDGVAGPYTLKGKTKDKDVVAVWTGLDQAAKLMVKTVNADYRKVSNEFSEAITSLRYVYKHIPSNQRQTFLNSVIFEILK